MRTLVLVLSLGLGAPSVGVAQGVDVSPDTTVTLSGTLVPRQKGATDDQAGSVISVMEPFALPSGANLTAFDARGIPLLAGHHRGRAGCGDRSR
jgi:hypothetical protein